MDFRSTLTLKIIQIVSTIIVLFYLKTSFINNVFGYGIFLDFTIPAFINKHYFIGSLEIARYLSSLFLTLTIIYVAASTILNAFDATKKFRYYLLGCMFLIYAITMCIVLIYNNEPISVHISFCISNIRFYAIPMLLALTNLYLDQE